MKYSVYVAVLILSILFVLVSVFLPITVYNRTDLVQVHLGWPLAFIVQEQSSYAPPFPWQTRLYSVWENPTQILWLRFFLNIAIVFGVFSSLLNFVKVIFLRTRKR